MGNFLKKTAAGAVIGLAFGILAAFGFAGVTRVVDRFFPRQTQSVAAADEEKVTEKTGEKSKEKEELKVETASLTMSDEGNIKKGGGEIGMSVTELAKNNLPCVVSITNTTVTQLRDMWSNTVIPYENVSRGSGIIIGQTDDELLIATNSHVVNGADSITVGFIDSEIYDATVKGEDTELDLAVIGVAKSDIKKDTLDQVKIAVIGDSDALEVGEQVVAIGNAVGYGQSVTTGIVSALNRDVPDDETDTCFIQTDAAINPGNSGGALLNMKGEVIGINSAKLMATQIEGMGYAIPMNTADPVIETLMNRKSRDKVDEKKAGYLGITGVSVDDQTSKMYGIPEGIYLQEVIEDGPADKAGLLKGDVLKKFDGESVSTIAELRGKLEYYEAGEKVDVVICRQEDGEYVDKTITVTLTSREGTALEKSEEDEDGESDKADKPDKNDKPDNDKKDEEDRSSEELYNSIPDELKQFFYGFGR